MFVYPKTARKGVNTNSSIAIKAPVAGEPPTELWIAHVSSGEALVATTTRVYGATASWRQEFSLGKAIDVAVMFDERWQMNNESKYRPVTVGNPVFFYIQPITATTGRLVTSPGWGVSPTTLEASGVSCVDAIHGWKSTRTFSDDQGRVVAYIKDGRPFFRRYYETTTQGVFVWSDPVEIAIPGTMKHISVFRTPDYRVAFMCTTVDGEATMAYSERMFAGVGITPAEHLSFFPTVSSTLNYTRIVDKKRDMREIVRASFDASSNVFAVAIVDSVKAISAMNPNATQIIVTLSNGVAIQDPALIVVRDSTNRRFRISSAEVKNGTLYGAYVVLEMEDFNNASGAMTITFQAGSLKSALALPATACTFNPQGLVPVFIPLPKVVSAYNQEVFE